MFERSKMAALWPEFGDAEIYPDVLLEAWREEAYAVLLESRWGKRRDFGAMLYCAHFIALARKAAASATGGASVEGIRTNKSVGPLSVGYDVASVTNQGAAFWNTTSYGIQFFTMLKGAAAGGLYLPSPSAGVPWAG